MTHKKWTIKFLVDEEKDKDLIFKTVLDLKIKGILGQVLGSVDCDLTVKQEIES